MNQTNNTIQFSQFAAVSKEDVYKRQLIPNGQTLAHFIQRM